MTMTATSNSSSSSSNNNNNNADTRQCLKCRQRLPLENFQPTKSKFFPGHRSMICTSCLETMIKSDNLDDVDALCRYLDVPFDADRWTTLYKVHKDRTLTAYFNTLLDDHYSSKTWSTENERWRQAREEGTINEEINVINESKMRRLKKEWSPAYTTDELLFLENYFNEIVATQNVSTPILENYARDLCEIELRIKKSLREGADTKKDMDARDNIIRMAHFEASNAKNAADFESVGELMVYFSKKGWSPNWHVEPKDSIDFLMQNIQNYLRRLVMNEGNFAEQVETKREQYNLTERLENLGVNDFDETANIDYEGDIGVTDTAPSSQGGDSSYD